VRLVEYKIDLAPVRRDRLERCHLSVPWRDPGCDHNDAHLQQHGAHAPQGSDAIAPDGRRD
jgi:hypothetical protein